MQRCQALASAAVLSCVVTPVHLSAQSSAVVGTEQSADAEAHLKRGEALAGAHKYDEAIAEYNIAIRLRPDYAEAYNDRGHSYHWKGGHGDRARADFTRAIDLRPNYPTAYNNRGVLYMAGGDPAKAIPEFDRALELNPNLRNAYVNRGNARLRLLQVSAALDDFHRAGMYPERLVAMLGGAVLLAASGIAIARRTRRRRRGGSV